MISRHPQARSFVAVLWLLLMSWGFLVLFRYTQRPGVDANASSDWPRGTNLSYEPHVFNLILFLHPHCPCSKASLAELERLLPHFQGRVRSRILFQLPEGKSPAWVQGELFAQAKLLPHVQALIDESGKEAERFGAMTSGQTFLYDSGGKLVFYGGITPSRGHQGDSEGRDAILAVLSGQSIPQSKTKTFGCALAQVGAQ